METTKPNAESAPSAAIEKLGPAIDVYKKTFAEIRERADRAILAGQSIVALPEEDETLDLYANNFLAKCNVTLETIKSARLSSTRILDEAKTWAMTPEKELEAEMDRIKKLRNERARKIAEAQAEQARAIEMQKAYDIHRGAVKAKMQESLQLGVSGRLKSLEDAIAKTFNECTLAKVGGLAQALNIKPSLKEEFFDKLLDVPFDQNIMSTDQFADAKAKGKIHFDFQKTNAVYIEMANKILAAWREKIPAKKLELERIAKASGEEAINLKAKADRDKIDEEARRKQEQTRQEEAIKTSAKDEEAKATLTAEFESHKAAQDIAEQSGTRKTKTFRIDPAVEIDFVKLSGFLGKLVLHVSLDKENFTGIFKRTKAGEIKLDEDGNPEYVEGVQYWLDQMKKVKYANAQLIPGLISTEKIATVAKAKV